MLKVANSGYWFTTHNVAAINRLKCIVDPVRLIHEFLLLTDALRGF